jgi:coenzyme F420-reducing hydrogenase gamma subunit
MTGGGRAYLGVPLSRPRVAFLDFTSCEGCQLQVLNNESSLLDFLSLVEIADFREALTERSEDYEIAFIEGSITRSDEAERLKKARKRAATLVALGSCACFGGVNQLKNRFGDQAEVTSCVYGDHPMESMEAMPVEAIVPVDLRVYGCPVSKDELERIVLSLALGLRPETPVSPVCMECKALGNICLFELGEPCLGPVTRAGCGAWCPGSRSRCWGCRGPVDEPNMSLMREVMDRHGFGEDTLDEMLSCFGGFSTGKKAVQKEARP